MSDGFNLDHCLKPGRAVRIADLPTALDKVKGNKDAGTAEFLKLRAELAGLQERLYAENKRRVLVVVQGLDASGKDGLVRDLFDEVNPAGLMVTSFKAPTATELAHDYLWRIHQVMPPSRIIGVFNRSHYEDVLIVRVDNLVPESVWRARYDQINHFEKMLVESGTTIVKLFLNVSKDEQRKRLYERMTVPEKQWKFSLADVAKHKQFAQYQAAYEELLNRCSTDWAPWYVLPSDQNWYRNLAAAQILVQALRDLNPQYPKPTEDWSGVSFD
jgi:PPK2 family polyphosphate:nucleotide phosphotransferase